MSALQISKDRAIDSKWFASHELSVYGGFNSIDIQNINKKNKQYDIVICNHVLEHIKNDIKALEELIRIVSDEGFLELATPDPCRLKKTEDWGYPDEKKHGHYRVYGIDIEDKFKETFSADINTVKVFMADPVTQLNDLFFFFTRSLTLASLIKGISEGEGKQQNDINKQVGNKWSKVSKQKEKSKSRTRWWQTSYIIREINQRVCGLPLDGLSAGIAHKAKEMAGDLAPFSKGVSVGSGAGAKEIRLIRQGLVANFTLYELSEYRVEQGKKLAREAGLEDRVNFIVGDAFELVKEEECFDFVHWNNSLHHMLDVEAAVKWSYKVLRKGGMFYMDDYVGKNYLQFNQKTSEVASRIRSVLPEKYLTDPKKTGILLPTEVKPQDKAKVIAADPSEAADSERIIPSVRKYFPDAEVILTGGAIYNTVINNMIVNIDENEDKFLLGLLMIIDELLAEQGENQYATALAIK